MNSIKKRTIYAKFAVAKENPFLFLNEASYYFHKTTPLDEEIDFYLDRCKYYTKTICDDRADLYFNLNDIYNRKNNFSKIAMHLALLDAYDKIAYRPINVKPDYLEFGFDD